MTKTCKKHPDSKSNPGVCASCLRDRLLLVQAALNDASLDARLRHPHLTPVLLPLSPSSDHRPAPPFQPTSQIDGRKQTRRTFSLFSNSCFHPSAKKDSKGGKCKRSTGRVDSNRGLSPDFTDRGSESGYSTAPSSSTWRLPTQLSVFARIGGGPLVRASPRRSQVTEIGGSFGLSRSRKLADRSRFR